MKRKKVKPIKAWAITFDGEIDPNECYTTRNDAYFAMAVEPPGQRIIRVIIKPVVRSKKEGER